MTSIYRNGIWKLRQIIVIVRRFHLKGIGSIGQTGHGIIMSAFLIVRKVTAIVGVSSRDVCELNPRIYIAVILISPGTAQSRNCTLARLFSRFSFNRATYNRLTCRVFHNDRILISTGESGICSGGIINTEHFCCHRFPIGSVTIRGNRHIVITVRQILVACKELLNTGSCI